MLLDFLNHPQPAELRPRLTCGQCSNVQSDCGLVFLAAPLKVMKTVGRRCGEIRTMNTEILTFYKALEFCSKDTY